MNKTLKVLVFAISLTIIFSLTGCLTPGVYRRPKMGTYQAEIYRDGQEAPDIITLVLEKDKDDPMKETFSLYVYGEEIHGTSSRSGNYYILYPDDSNRKSIPFETISERRLSYDYDKEINEDKFALDIPYKTAFILIKETLD